MLLCFEHAKENNALLTNEESHLHGATVLRLASFVITCECAVHLHSPSLLFAHGGSQIDIMFKKVL